MESVGVRGFRNLTSVDVELGPRLNVVSGDNGQGKTNLLEAVYLVATSRSFRAAKPAELIEIGGSTASVRAVVREGEQRREQSVGLGAGVRSVKLDGKRPATLAAYAVRTPVVVFHPAIMELSAGPGAERRRLLDRLALYASPASAGDMEAYGKAARARQRVLEMRGERAADLDGWEELMARHGDAVSRARQGAAERLAPAAARAFARIGPPGLTLGVRYAPASPEEVAAFRAALAASRARDRARGSATVGPHRDDVVLTLDGKPVRGMASQGQHRAVVLSLELAEMEVVGDVRGVWPILLLDDVSSELDRERTRSLLAALGEGRGQIVVTTTRRELIEAGGAFTPGERSDFTVVAGSVMAG